MSPSTLCARTLSGWAWAGPKHAVSFCEFIHVPVLLYLEDTVSLVSSLPLALTPFLQPLSHNFLKEFDELIPLRT